MREVRVRYTGAQLMNTEFKELFAICEKMTLMGNIWRDKEAGFLRQAYEIKMIQGHELDELNDIPWLVVEEILSVREERGQPIHTAICQNYHGLSLIGETINSAVVVPDSFIGRTETLIIIRGSPKGCKQMVEGFRQFKEPVSISVVDSTPSEEDYLTKSLSEQKIKAFEAAWKLGYYENPRQISPKEIAASIDISRVTLSGHLRNIESHLAALLASQLDL